MANYRDKLRDSLVTRIQLFLFNKILKKEPIKIEEINSCMDEILNFEITNELANFYSNTYYQIEKEKKISFDGKNEILVKDIINNMPSKTKLKELFKTSLNDMLHEYKKIFEQNFSEKLYKSPMNENARCEYCGISINQIKILGATKQLNNKRSDTRGYTLEIDRKLPNLEYSDENCCMACYWCNNAKTDEFAPLEFKEIARGINKVWNERLSKAKEVLNSKENLEEFEIEFSKEKENWKLQFDEYSTIWTIDFDTPMQWKIKSPTPPLSHNAEPHRVL